MAAQIPAHLEKWLKSNHLPLPDWYVESAEGGWSAEAELAWAAPSGDAATEPADPAR